MAFDQKAHFKMLRKAGLSNERAKIQTIFETNRQNDLFLNSGQGFSEEHVRHSIVLTRQDVALIAYCIMEIHEETRNRWNIVMPALIFCILVSLWIKFGWL